MASLSTETAIDYFNETHKIESIYKKTDRFTEQFKEELVDKEEVDSESEDIADWLQIPLLAFFFSFFIDIRNLRRVVFSHDSLRKP